MLQLQLNLHNLLAETSGMDAVAMAFSKMGTPIDRAYSRPALDNANEKPGLTAAFTAAEGEEIKEEK